MRFAMLGLTLALLGCSEERDRPPPLTGAGCEGDSCRPQTSSTGSVAGGSGNGGEGGEGSSPSEMPDGGMDPSSQTGGVSGSVRRLVSADLGERQPLPADLVVDIATEGPSGVTRERYRGGGEDFVFTDLVASASAFFSVEYVEGQPELMNTLTVVDLTRSGEVELGAIELRVMEGILDSGNLSQVTDLQEGMGHAFIRVVDAAGDPVAGVSVTRHTAQTAGYDAAGTYSDLLPETQFRGVVLLVNMEASPFPGAESDVDVTDGNLRATLTFPVVANTVTLASVTLAP